MYDSVYAHDPMGRMGTTTTPEAVYEPPEDHDEQVAEDRYHQCRFADACDRAAYMHAPYEQTWNFMRCEECNVYQGEATL